MVGVTRLGAGPTDGTNYTCATYSDASSGNTFESFLGNNQATKGNLYFATYGGKVGIGTNSITSLLEINGQNTNQTIDLVRIKGGYPGYSGSYANALAIYDKDNATRFFRITTDYTMLLERYTSLGTYFPSFYVSPTGTVGINTYSPTQRFSVNEGNMVAYSTGSGVQTSAGCQNTTSGEFKLTKNGSTVGNYGVSTANDGILYNSAGNMVIGNDSATDIIFANNSGFQRSMTIFRGGSVSIGSSSSISNLAVVGSTGITHYRSAGAGGTLTLGNGASAWQIIGNQVSGGDLLFNGPGGGTALYFSAGNNTIAINTTTVGGQLTINNTPSARWGLDFTAGASSLITIANNGTYDLAGGSGMVIIYVDDGFGAGLFMAWFGATTLVNQSSANGMSNLIGTAGKVNFSYNAGTGAYRIQNLSGASRNMYVTMIRTRASV